ncbi:MAG: polysaccharide lyase beta-sandwich domain-containing protein [Niabella sp.]
MYHNPTATDDSTGDGYALIYSPKSKHTASLVARPKWETLSNNRNVQPVRLFENTYAVAFFSPGLLAVDGSTLAISKPCLILVKGTTVYISYPLHKEEEIQINWKQQSPKIKPPNTGTTEKFVF